MESILEVSNKSVDNWNNGYISAGAVAGVGDVLQNVRLKQSAPGLPMRFEYTDAQLVQRGQNVQDGQKPNWTTGGLGPVTIVNDVYNTSVKSKQVGVVFQELAPSNLASSTRVAARPQDSWKSQTAQTFLAKTTGGDFLPLPGGYPNAGIPRGPIPNRNVYVDTAATGFESAFGGRVAVGGPDDPLFAAEPRNIIGRPPKGTPTVGRPDINPVTGRPCRDPDFKPKTPTPHPGIIGSAPGGS